MEEGSRGLRICSTTLGVTGLAIGSGSGSGLDSGLGSGSQADKIVRRSLLKMEGMVMVMTWLVMVMLVVMKSMYRFDGR